LNLFYDLLSCRSAIGKAAKNDVRSVRQVTVLVTAPSGGARKLTLANRLRRTLSRDRKPRSVAVTSSLSITSRYGMTAITRCPSGSSMSEAAALMASTGSESGLGSSGTRASVTYSTML
jgi:hypothetical protein